MFPLQIIFWSFCYSDIVSQSFLLQSPIVCFLYFLFFMGDCHKFIFCPFNWICYSLYLKFFWVFPFIVSYLWFQRCNFFFLHFNIFIVPILFEYFQFVCLIWPPLFFWEAVLKCRCTLYVHFLRWDNQKLIENLVDGLYSRDCQEARWLFL